MIGRLNKRVTLERNQQTTVGAGGVVTPTTPVIGTVYASVKPVSGRSQFAHNRLQYTVTHVVRTRYSAAYLAARFITYNARTFRVHAALEDDEGNRWIDFHCEEGAPK